MSNKVKWTVPQQNAISSRGGTLLVSAAAGSGKTAVLSQRAVDRMLDPINPIDGDRLLVATFSRAAAKEMRHRIITKLNEAIEDNPSDPVPRRQRQLAQRAQISTIHSFCLELVRQNFQRAGVSPNFRIGDPLEMDDVHMEVLSEVLEERYKLLDNTDFFDVVELLSSGQNDKNLEKTILSIYNFIRSLPFYSTWVNKRLELYQPQNISSSIWGKEVLAYALEGTTYALALAEKGLEIISQEDALEQSHQGAFIGDKAFLQSLEKTLRLGDWDGALKSLQSFSHTRLGGKKVIDEQLKELSQACRSQIKDIVKNIKDNLTVCTQNEFLEDLKDLLPKVKELFEIVLEFDKKVSIKKRELSLLDYSDLEHLTVELLVKPKPNSDKFSLTDLAEELAGQYDEIMVDECQDINGVQDLIFGAISKGDNLFFVGDVKQSIYSFRQAMPQLFIEKLDSYSRYDGKTYPAKVVLSDNFRSRKEVTEPINFIFSLLMNRRIGAIDYSPEEYLNPAVTFEESPDCGWEVHLLDKKELEGDQKSHAEEARYVAALADEILKSGYMVKDAGGSRPVVAGDICVLIRSPKNVIEHYRRGFAGMGIQAAIDVGGEFLTTLEIRAMLNILKAIDNPLLDIEIAGAMLSPMFGFTAEELAKIRLVRHRGSFYNAVRADIGTQKTVDFVKTLRKFRQISSADSVTSLVNAIYEETMFDLTVRAMEGGELRFANLMLLMEYIDSYEKRGVRGLSGVIRTFDSILAKGKDLEPASVSSASNSVTIMSIHKSKGLEFPVVILANAAGRFNKSEVNSSSILDNEMGFTCKRREPLLKKQYNTLPLVAAKIKNTGEMLSEEMRILYVALTRAKERLIVTASLNDPSAYAAKLLTPLENGRLPVYMIRSKNCYIDWLLAGILHMDKIGDSLLNGKDYSENNFKIVFGKAIPPNKTTATATSDEASPPPNQELISRIKSQCSYAYPYKGATTAPSKLSVSELAQHGANRRLFAKTPNFVLGEEISPTERGNAVHSFMQFCDFDNAHKDVKAELDRLGSMGILTPRQIRAVNLNALKDFFASKLWGRVMTADKILREYRFISHLTGDNIGSYTVAEDGEPTILQGIADLILIKNNKATLVDFKTDRISSPQKLADAYRNQLLLYRDMIGDNLNIAVESAVLYSFHQGAEVKVF